MGVQIVFNNLPHIGDEIRAGLGTVVAAAALNIEATAKASMAEPKTGREYKRKGKTHRASAPGQSPAIDTGALANSIQADTSKAASDLYAEVTAGTEYAEVLEFGGGTIAARPFLTPAAEAERPQLEKAAAVVLGKVSKKAGNARRNTETFQRRVGGAYGAGRRGR